MSSVLGFVALLLCALVAVLLVGVTLLCLFFIWEFLRWRASLRADRDDVYPGPGTRDGL